MRARLALLAPLPVLLPGAWGSAAAAPDYAAHVLEIVVTQQRFDQHRPWVKHSPVTGLATGVVVAGDRVLTEGAILRNATLVQLQKRASARRVPARVAHIDPDVDLALLAVDEPGFFDDLEPVRVAESVPTEGLVHSVRWRNRQLEISNSRVAHLEVRESPYGSLNHLFLHVTTDFAKSGWAEPVFANGQLVGITVSQQGQLSAVIPAEIVSAYLRRAGSADYPGFASINPGWQKNEDPALSAYLGLADEPRGIVLLRIPWGSTGCDVLEPRDILLSLGGRPLDILGNFEDPRYGQLRFHDIVARGGLPGETIPALVLRRGELLELEVPLRRYGDADRLLPVGRDDSPPAYLVAGGLVLRELDGAYLRAWGDDWRSNAPSNLVYRYDLEQEDQSPERRRTLILSRVLPSAYNIGYHDLANLTVAEINGRPVGSVAEADEAFGHPEDGLHRVAFEGEDLRWPVLLDAAEFEAATARILAAYDVPERRRLPSASAPAPRTGCAPRGAAAN